MSNAVKAVYLTLWSLVDLGVTSLLYPQTLTGYSAAFLSNVLHYTVFYSMWDLWLLALVRSSLVIGVLVGYLRNTTDGTARVRNAAWIIKVLAVIMWDFPIIKLLLYSGYSTDMDRPLFWALFAWTLLAAVMLMVNWHLLGTFKSLRTSRTLSVNASGEERQSLLNPENPTEKPAESPKSQVEDGSAILRLMAFSKPDIPLLLVAFVFLILSSVAQIYIPWYTGQVIEGIAITRDESRFIHSIILMAIISAASALAAGVRGGCFSLCISRLNIRIRNKLFSCLLSQEIGFFDVTQTGEITSRLIADTTIMSDTLGLNVNVFLRSIITSVGICFFMFKLSWQLSLVTVVGLPIILGVSEGYGKYMEKLSKKIQDSQAEANQVAEEVCSTMRTVRSFAGERAEVQRYKDRLQVTYGIQKKEAAAYAGYMWCSELFSLLLVVATLYYGGLLVIHDKLTGGQLVSFILYQMQLGYQLESIAAVFTGLMQAVGASKKVLEFIHRKPEIRNTGMVRPPQFAGKLEFRNVSFCYPSRPDTQVLKNVSFTVAPGEVVALVGPSGSGKSSCISLFEHFYETATGEVLLDGVPIKDYDHQFLHEKVALVGQEPVLYARSIQDNIAYGLSDWTPDMVVQAAKMANAHNFIMELKDKYKTQTGEKGLQLSGGQKQRVAIARAVIRSPRVLLLDEATSALDSESEHVVQEALYKNLSGHTVILVAHRLSTVEKADRILVINKGVIVEEGSHQSLVKAGGLYSKLVQRQLLGADIGLSPQQNSLSGATRPSSTDPKTQLLKGASPMSMDPKTELPKGASPTLTYGSFKSVGSEPGARNFQQNHEINFHVGSPSFGSFSDAAGSL